jgi:hypothetical protein
MVPETLRVPDSAGLWRVTRKAAAASTAMMTAPIIIFLCI